MSMMQNIIETEQLVFIFIGRRGNKAGIEFCRLIIDDAREKKKNMPFDFLSRIFFIATDEFLLTEIFDIIEGYVPEENVLFVSNLETDGDIWSNVEENDVIFSKKIFRSIMFHLDQIEKPHTILVYSISSGLTAGIADYLTNNLAIIKPHMEITVFGSILHSETDGPLAVYWTLLGLNTLLSNRVTGTIFLDYSAIGNYVYYIRNETEEEISFEYYDKIVGFIIYSLTIYDRYPFANLVPYVDLIKNLVLFNKMKFIIPYIISPKKKLRDDEQYYGFLEELIRDGNLFSFTPELIQVRIDKEEYGEYGEDFEYDDEEISNLPQKTVLSNEFISFGEKHNVDYLYMIRKSLPEAINYLPGGNYFYTYPTGKTYALILENNTNIKFFLESLLDKFDKMVRRKSYFHILEDLNIDNESFNKIIDGAIALIESYQECENMLYELVEEEIEELNLDSEDNSLENGEEGISENSDYDDIIVEGAEKNEELIGVQTIEILDEKILTDENTKNINEEILNINEVNLEKPEQTMKDTSNLQKSSIKFSKVESESEKSKKGVIGWIEKQKEKEEQQLNELEKKKEELINKKKEMEEEEEKKRIQEEKEMEEKKNELAELSDLFSKLD